MNLKDRMKGLEMDSQYTIVGNSDYVTVGSPDDSKKGLTLGPKDGAYGAS